ncbi:MAG: adenosylmethionine-8-amino-7-oxononanoate aminotransferase [Bradymonadia bacterium]|jgi:adenosylmethionine-8-amino-7-oxononanoate aminotransferase
MNQDQLRAWDRAHVWHPFTSIDSWEQECAPVIERAEGPFLFTADGQRLYDIVGSWWVSNLGHGFPPVAKAMKAQIDRMSHVAIAGLVHEPSARLAAMLAEVAPSGLTRTFYSDNGSTSVEVAVRAAFQYWQQNGRPERTLFLSLEGAYHGDTIGAVSVGGIPEFHAKFGPLLFETIKAKSPGETWFEEAFDDLESRLRAESDRVAAVVVEPLVQGAAGMLMYPPEYLSRLRVLCDELDVFLIADEVFVGFGRTGTLFACEQASITPDFICLSKGLTAGFMPLGVTMTTERVIDGFRGDKGTFYYGHSYCGNPLGCSAAVAVLESFQDGTILRNVAERGAQMQRWLDEIHRVPGVTDIRRTGMIGAVQLGEKSDYREETGWKVYRRALELGAYARPLGNVTYLVPPLTISEEQLAEALDILGTAIRDVL